ncbi:MAG: hypothetical protein FWE21_04890 [Defluviitaleaceae bacterium]|nr:hypothetical protein [Defluviitaleaceae bacterium]
MKKRILASLLGLAMLAAPVTAYAQTVNVPTEVIVAGVANAAQFIEVHNGNAYFGLRSVAEAYLGQGSVVWNQATQTITISFSGADVAARLAESTGIDLAGVIQPGTFSIDLRSVEGGALVVANGPAAGTRLVSTLINDRHMIPATMFPRSMPLDAAAAYGELTLATGLIQTAIQNLTGRTVSYNVTPAGVNVTLGQ